MPNARLLSSLVLVVLAAGGAGAVADPPAATVSPKISTQTPPTGGAPTAAAERDKLAREQGTAAQRAVERLLKDAGPERSGEINTGSYIIAYALLPPQGRYERQNQETIWREPDNGSSAHLCVVVRDAHDGRIVPGLIVRAALIDPVSKQAILEPDPLPFAWYPLVQGYGENVALPAGAKDCRLRIHIEAPTVPRYEPHRAASVGTVTTATLAESATLAYFDGITIPSTTSTAASAATPAVDVPAVPVVAPATTPAVTP